MNKPTYPVHIKEIIPKVIVRILKTHIEAKFPALKRQKIRMRKLELIMR